jgi:hypothetical protein
MACHFREFNATADCEGWRAYGSIYISGVTCVDLNWEVTLTQGATTVAYFSGTEAVCLPDDSFDLGSPWGVELCGDYIASGSFYFTSPYGNDCRSFEIAFTCPCDTTPDGCYGTPGFWKNRSEAWPVSSLILGPSTYNTAELLAIFDMPTRGDITVILAQHLIAAKLNLIIGGEPSIQPSIDAADSYLTTHALGSKPNGATKTLGGNIKEDLKDYNELGCPDGYPAAAATLLFLKDASSPVKTSAGTESRSWGAIKDLYK